MILLVLSLLGADTGPLADREYAVREAAQARLESLGWLAAPALWGGMQSDTPEVADRCSVAWAGLISYRSLPVLACKLIDASGGFDKDRDSWRWVQLKPYLNGSVEGDLRYAAELAVKRGVPQRMPPPER